MRFDQCLQGYDEKRPLGKGWVRSWGFDPLNAACFRVISEKWSERLEMQKTPFLLRFLMILP
jgi:hypothetical protein